MLYSISINKMNTAGAVGKQGSFGGFCYLKRKRGENMSITVSKLCANAQANYVMKLVAGKEGLGNYVRWVHLVENADVSLFLHGNEMVFMTGVGINDEGHLLRFVEELIEKRCSALVINTGKYIKSIPQSVKDCCDINSLPLFSVPWEVKLIDITYDFWHRIVTGEEIETALATALRNLIFSPENEAGYKSTLERRSYFPSSDYCVGVCGFSETDLGDDELKKAATSAMQKVLNTSGRQFSFFFQDKNLVTVCPDCKEEDVRKILSIFDTIFNSGGAHLRHKPVKARVCGYLGRLPQGRNGAQGGYSARRKLCSLQRYGHIQAACTYKRYIGTSRDI